MKIIKRFLGTLLAVMLIAAGIYYAPTQVEEVEAATATEVHVEQLAVTGLRSYDEENEKYIFIAPVATAEGYEDYLFAGWYKDNECTAALEQTDVTTSTAYAKFVPKDTLNVKFQISNNTVSDVANGIENQYAIRFISSVDSLDYSAVGFVLDGDVDNPYSRNVVYERIDSAVKGLDYEFSPKVIGLESEYFITGKLAVDTALVAKEYTVNAYWKTLDGTMVQGAGRRVCVNDNAVNIINLPIEKDLDESLTYTATVNDTDVAVTKTEVLDANNIRITLGADDNVLTELSSATIVTLSADGEDDISAICRNYYTSHESTTTNTDGTYVGTVDRTWYDETLKVNPNETKFVIASSADLYGLADIVNSGTTLSGATIIQVRDININEGEAVKAADAGTAAWIPEEDEEGNVSPVYEWIPIAEQETNARTICFSGIYEGDNNDISGLHITTKYKWGTGLFGCAKNATIQNVALKNSFFVDRLGNEGDSVIIRSGSIVGYFMGGTIENVYSNTVMSCTSREVGGLVGVTDGADNLYNCWFDGEITLDYYGTGSLAIGGLVGNAYNDTTNLNACLYSGTIDVNFKNKNTSQEWKNVGGICGGSNNTNNTLKLTNSISAGEIHLLWNASTECVVKNFTGYGAITGNTNTRSNITDTYAATLIKVTDSNQTDATDKTAAANKNGTYEVDETHMANESALYGQTGAENLTNLIFEKTDDTPYIWAIKEGALPIPETLKIFFD